MRLNAVPQFQGAATGRAPEAPERSVALAELASRIFDVPVDSEPQDRDTSPRRAGVANCAALVDPHWDAQRDVASGLGVAWFDAHPDVKTPETAHDVACHAMVLAGLPGEGDPELRASKAVDPAKAALIGARAAIDAEQAAMQSGHRIHGDEPAAVLREATHIYIHVDLDVLDPSEFVGHNMPKFDGMKIGELLEPSTS